MISLQYPAPQFKIKNEGERNFIFCLVRKQWILLTEEEWVRQNFIQYLTNVLNYPLTLIAVEKEFLLNGLKKRFDILVYDSSHKPWMLIECKEPAVQLSETVLQQALRYTMTIPVSYIIITNGNTTIGWEKKGSLLALLEILPPHK